MVHKNGIVLGVIGTLSALSGIFIFIFSNEVNVYIELILATVAIVSFTAARMMKKNWGFIVGQYLSLLYLMFAFYLLWISFSWK